VNKKNPRHTEFESEIDAIKYFCLVQSTKTLKLCKSIVNNEFFGDSTLLITDSSDGKYIVLDGNRRLTAIKILNDPDLVPDEPECRTLRNYTKTNQQSISEVHCYYYEDSNEAKSRIRSLHTDTGAQDNWDPIAQIRFDLEDNTPPFWYQVIEENDTTLFNGIDNVSTIDRLLNRQAFNLYIPVDEKLHFLHPNGHKLLKKALSDISSGLINSRDLNTSNGRKKYLDSLVADHNGTSNHNQSTSSNGPIQQGDPQPSNQGITTSIIDSPEQIALQIFEPTEPMVTPRPAVMNVFDHLRVTYSTQNTNEMKFIDGINKIIQELRDLKNTKRDGFYLSKLILTRTLIELSFKLWFHIFHFQKYTEITKNETLDARLGEMINQGQKMIRNNKPFFPERSINDAFANFFSLDANKKLLDDMVHHPYLQVQNKDTLDFFTTGSIFHIINYILTYKSGQSGT
jgi:hypothetical protein